MLLKQGVSLPENIFPVPLLIITYRLLTSLVDAIELNADGV